jgi:hypothetical protein
MLPAGCLAPDGAGGGSAAGAASTGIADAGGADMGGADMDGAGMGGGAGSGCRYIGPHASSNSITDRMTRF